MMDGIHTGHQVYIHTAIVSHELGDSGLDGFTFPPLPASSVLLPGKASHEMFRIITAHDSLVTLVATGALTNVALLVTVYPEVSMP